MSYLENEEEKEKEKEEKKEKEKSMIRETLRASLFVQALGACVKSKGHSEFAREHCISTAGRLLLFFGALQIANQLRFIAGHA